MIPLVPTSKQELKRESIQKCSEEKVLDIIEVEEPLHESLECLIDLKFFHKCIQEEDKFWKQVSVSFLTTVFKSNPNFLIEILESLILTWKNVAPQVIEIAKDIILFCFITINHLETSDDSENEEKEEISKKWNNEIWKQIGIYDYFIQFWELLKIKKNELWIDTSRFIKIFTLIEGFYSYIENHSELLEWIGKYAEHYLD